MSLLKKIYEKIGIDKRIINIYNGTIIPPYFYTYRASKGKNYAYPPFLIPIFEDGSDPSYIGVVYHPFSNRQKVFVKYDLSAGFMWEIARTSDQLLTSFIIDSIQNNDDVLDRLILSFSKDISIDLNNNFKETYDKLYDGNPFETYHYFQVFRELTPAAYQKDINSYDGDFPSFINQLNISAIENASDLEINNRIDKNSVNQPPYWLKSENKKQLFDTYFNNNEFSKAWLTLNSSGWKCEEVKISLEKLKQKNNDDLFGLVADNWINNLYNKNEKEFIY